MAVLGLRVSIDSRDLDYMRTQLRSMPEKIPQALAASINATLTRCRRIIVDGVKEATTIKNKSRIVKDTNIHKASAKKGGNWMTGYINVIGRPVGALQFDHRVSDNLGVMFTANKNDNPQRFRHGFKGTGINENKHLWIRKPGVWHTVGAQAHHKPNIGRRMEKLRPIYGPRIQIVYARNPNIRRAAEAAAQKILSERMKSQVDRFLNRKKADRPELAEAA